MAACLALTDDVRRQRGAGWGGFLGGNRALREGLDLAEIFREMRGLGGSLPANVTSPETRAVKCFLPGNILLGRP